MTLLQIISVQSLTGKFHNQYRGLASDGLYLYCTVPNCKKIYCFDPCFSMDKIYPVCRPYSSICYDECKKCFWALSLDSSSCIYQLDSSFNEIDCINLSFPYYNQVPLNGICCGFPANELTLTAPGFLAKVCKNQKQLISFKKERNPRRGYLCAEMLYTDYIFAISQNDLFKIVLHIGSKDIPLHCFPNNEYIPIDFAVQYIPQRNNCCQLYILVVDSCGCCHILKCMISMGSHKCKPSSQQSCSDLIESIALIEASLSHILNAEGEKLQKVIQSSNDFFELIRVNDSVDQTIKDVTELEKVLLEKLRIAAQCNSECFSSPENVI